MRFLCDTREQTPWPAPKHREMVRACLPFGDYSIEGSTERVCVERKGEIDLLQSFGQDFERFSSRLSEMAGLELACIVAETSGERQWADLLCFHPDLPSVIVRVERDERFIAALAEHVGAFVDQLAEATRKATAAGWIKPQYDPTTGELP